MRIDKFFKPATTLVAGMAMLAVAEMFVPKIASVIVTAGNKVKKLVGGK